MGVSGTDGMGRGGSAVADVLGLFNAPGPGGHIALRGWCGGCSRWGAGKTAATGLKGCPSPLGIALLHTGRSVPEG